MPQSASKKSKSPATKAKTPKKLPPHVKAEILRVAQSHDYDAAVLEALVQFAIAPPKPPKPLTLTQLKAAVYKHFEVKSTPALRKSGSFQMATDGMEDLNLAKKDAWEWLYREFVGVLPGEEYEEGKDCINGVNIFKYFFPWKVFGLDSQTSTDEDVKRSYRQLSKIYHPDNPETGDSRIFQRINQMYRSLVVEA